ncbi:hypothetical protein [uncultured Tenacibaculum sp.]|uniref:GldL-related protein n=1 Tax=uncultured Tenacibaculum sp. TaxID=174713 RepID=UPI002607549E|nr:hypothetical protein [uncultured Tenacibaculum sp.]
MNNKLFIVLISLLVLTGLIGFSITLFSKELDIVNLGQTMFHFGFMIGAILGGIMLLVNGTFVKTKYFRFAKGFFSIVIIGALIRIMHWSSYANILISLGLIGIMTSYFVSFLKKPIKKRLDYLKLTWVIVSYTLVILSLLHLIKKEYTNFGSYLLWLTILDFIVVQVKSKPLLNPKN